MNKINESWSQTIERHTIGRTANLVRIPLNLIAQAAMITKIALKALFIAPVEALVNLGLYTNAYRKGEHKSYEYTTLFGADRLGFFRDVKFLERYFIDNGNFFMNVIAAPSIESYRNQPFRRFFEDRIDAIFTNEIPNVDLRVPDERNTGPHFSPN